MIQGQTCAYQQLKNNHVYNIKKENSEEKDYVRNHKSNTIGQTQTWPLLFSKLILTACWNIDAVQHE